MNRNGILFCVLILSLIIGISNLIKPAAAASTITVNTTDDTIVNDSICSLREAVIAANTNSAFNGCTAGSGTDNIEFASSLPKPITIMLTLTGKNEDSSMTGDLDITEDVIIVGAGENDSIIDGNGSDRVFEVHSGKHLTLSGMTMQNGNPGAGMDGGGLLVWGRLTLNDSTVTANQGSGLSNNGGLVVLTNVHVNNNSSYGIRNHSVGTLTFDGGTVSGNSAGGIYNAASTTTLTNLTISENTNGSGVYNLGNTSPTKMTIDLTDIFTNTTTANGGGVYNSGNFATTNMTNSRISNNTANAGSGAGGGIFNNGIMTVKTSTIDHNRARTGAGIEHSGSNLNLENDTISSNQAGDNGGGLYIQGSTVLKHVTVNANTASTGANIFNDEASMSIENSIVANSDAQGNCFNSNGFINSQGHNLDSGDTCEFNASGDITNSNPLLGVLADNGGPTMTHALNSGSPAIDQGGGACPATDQRGVIRPQGAACDIGAYEADSTADLAVNISTSSPLISVSDTMTYTIEVTNIGSLTAVSVVLTDTLPVSVTHVDSFADGGGTCLYSSTVRCTLSSLAAGSKWTVTVVVNTPAFEQQITNLAEVSTTTPESNLSNNTAVFLANVSIIRSVYLPLIMKN